MKKTIFLIRHAKSDQHTFSKDFDRPLNERGNRDAPAMAKELKAKQPAVDAIIYSPAKRTLTTANFFAKEYNLSEKQVIPAPDLYLANPDTFYTVLEELNDNLQSIIVVAHNPGISEFAGAMVQDIKIAGMPTCAIFAFTVNSSSWKDFNTANKEFLFFDYPKLH